MQRTPSFVATPAFDSPSDLFDVTTPAGLASIARLRERFFDDPTIDLPGIRPQIAQSWRRSLSMSVDPAASLAIDPAAHIDDQTLECAAPFISELERSAQDAGGYVTLTSPRGSLVRDITPGVDARFAHGSVLLESACGTNGDGTALEDAQNGWVFSQEHYREDFRDASCFSVLLRDPFRDNVRACLTLTLPEAVMLASDARVVALVAQGTAAKITRELTTRSATREQLLFAEYLRVHRRYRKGAIVATDGKHTTMSDPALELLREDDFCVISGYAQEALREQQESRHQVTLSGSRRVDLQITLVGQPGDALGAIVLVKPLVARSGAADRKSSCATVLEPSAPAPFGDLLGANEAFLKALQGGAGAVARRKSVHVLGDHGTGKGMVALRVAGAWSDDVRVFDCASAQQDLDGLVADVREHLTKGGAVVLSEAEALTAMASAHLSELVRPIEQPKVVVTMRRPTAPAVALTAALHTVEVALPPLRARREDIPALAMRFIADLTDKKPSARLLYVLGQADWPGNVQTLRDVVEQAAMRARGAEVNVDDLPHSFRNGSMERGSLSRLEEVEIHELRTALEEADGNRTQAAELLQMGRSTLYRRLDSYRRRGIVF